MWQKIQWQKNNTVLYYGSMEMLTCYVIFSGKYKVEGKYKIMH